MNCKYCGKPAGFLRRTHGDCDAKHSQGCTQIISLLASPPSADVEVIANEVNSLGEASFIAPSELRTLLIQGWSAALSRYLDDDLLDEDEENHLVRLQNKFGLTQSELESDGSYCRAAKASVLRSIMNGDIPDKIKINGELPFNFQKGEKIVWVFRNVNYLEDKTRREYVGKSQGVSVRIAKGVYYRTGAFRGHPVEYQERVHADTGVMAITDKNLYFAGSSKSLRVPYRKIVTIQPYSDGIGIVKDTSSAKAQVFVTGDGWFTYNLATNLSQM